MKKAPMILLLIVPYAILIACYQANLDFLIGLYIYGTLFVFNMAYAFLMPRIGFNGQQILFWNLLLKLCNIPLVLLILLSTLMMTLIGGETFRGKASSMIGIAFLSCYLLQLSSTMFGFRGFLWCYKSGKLSKMGLVVSTIAQLIPAIDVFGSILCYIILSKKGQSTKSANS